MFTFGVLGLSCASPGGPVWWGRRGFTRQPRRPGQVGPPGFHTTAREPKRAHLRVPVFKNTTKIQRKGPTREGEKNKNCGGRGKKRAKFWAVRRRGSGGGALNTPTTHTTQQQHNTTTTQHTTTQKQNNTQHTTHNTQHTTHNNTTTQQHNNTQHTTTQHTTTQQQQQQKLAKTLKH